MRYHYSLVVCLCACEQVLPFPQRIRDPVLSRGEMLGVLLNAHESSALTNARHARCPATHAEVHHRVAGVRVRLYEVLHQRNGFLCRVQPDFSVELLPCGRYAELVLFVVLAPLELSQAAGVRRARGWQGRGTGHG